MRSTGSVVLGLVVLLASPQARAGHVDRWLTHRDPAVATPDKRIGNEILYQIFVDRFANGNPGNECQYDGRFCSPDHSDWYRYWGGDIRGMIQKMPYLKELGITRLWITPVFQNQQVMARRNRHGRDVLAASYHGYRLRDWFRLNEMFTDHGIQDLAIMDELVAAGSPEIRLLLDTVVNHTSSSDAEQDSIDELMRLEPLDQSDGIRRTHRGALFRDGVYVTSWDEDNQRAASRQPGYQRFFHPYGWITDSSNQFEAENYQLQGLTDLDQTNPAVDRYMIDAHRFWMQRLPQLAGFRMDTIKHVPQTYWRHFDQELGDAFPRMEVVGEYFGAGPGNAGSRPFYRDTRMTMFDFEFREALESVYLRGGSVEAFTRLWEKDPQLGDARSLVTFIDNHDMPRLRGRGMSFAQMRQATALMFAARGIPTIYYGLEQDLFYPGDPGDPYNRPMMSRWDRDAELFKIVRELAALRKRNPALRYGKTHVVHQSERILAFERVLDDARPRVFFAMSTNPIAGRDEFAMQGLSFPDGVYADILNGRRYEVHDGVLSVQLGRDDVIVLEAR